MRRAPRRAVSYIRGRAECADADHLRWANSRVLRTADASAGLGKERRPIKRFMTGRLDREQCSGTPMDAIGEVEPGETFIIECPWEESRRARLTADGGYGTGMAPVGARADEAGRSSSTESRQAPGRRTGQSVCS